MYRVCQGMFEEKIFDGYNSIYKNFLCIESITSWTIPALTELLTNLVVDILFFYWIQITTKYFNLFILSYHKTNIRKGVILVYNSQGANRNRKDLLFENWFKW